ncbi:hypothetical protein BIY26_01570 [Brenneria goodwinii]|uniref:Type III effector n=1 Tax=Brenneria goodwinii TaxID=1109412 RepID=A0A0G4JPR3_9GAMM|nr:hypothetical protein [Brenneria goodwinii]ATA24958.1 hypothetical protein AWC36_12995 [Brenneria goodwinii]MCG8155574.1 hypothetical protein [Brenneria goodwinii]MCG8160399.1 hypothetical protein [Brenneria goodwinii]MCG8164922.1 hypothetical protein [Brenneria goodwinii]MCG8169421.1 hypothetical protein [Brenneria goodwinii]
MLNATHNRYFPGGVTVNPLENFSREHTVKLHNAVSAQELGIGDYEGKRVSVSASTMEHLQLAQETLRKVKMLLPYGAGNQKVEMVYTNGESSARSLMHRERSSANAPIPNASQAARYQAGNCEEHADIAYALLAQNRINAPVLHVGDSDWEHKYILIGDPRDQTWGEKNTVVVDPWVRYPAAVTLEQASRRNPYPEPEYQRARNASPLTGAQALNSIRHVTTGEVSHYLAEIELPSLGDDFLEWFSQSEVASETFDEKTAAKDPSTRYSSNLFNARSMDDIAQATVSRQRAAQQAWNNSPYRW